MFLLKLLEPILVLLGLLHFKLFSSQYCYENEEVVRKKQFIKLKKLLCTSYDEISFYRKKYNSANFNPHSDFNSLLDMEKVPILSKDEARMFQEELVNHRRNRFALEFKTSGSTGNPFKALISPRHWIIEQSCVWRHWSWAGYKFRDKMAIVRSHVPKDENDLIKVDRLRNFYYFSPFHLTDEHIRFYLQQMKANKIQFLRGYPSSILAIANFVKRNPNVELPKFKAVLTASERLGSVEKRTIESNLSAPVFNHYGLAEQIVMFGGCEKGTHMHNYEEYGFLELLESGDGFRKIIGTNFHNYAMPLIRYDTGDIAEIADSICCCKRTSIVVKNVVGREDSVIYLPDNSAIPVTNFYTMFEHYDEYLSAWQMIQNSKDCLTIIIELVDMSDEDNVRTMVESDINSRVFGKLKLDFDFNGNFEYVGEGKRNPFIKLKND